MRKFLATAAILPAIAAASPPTDGIVDLFAGTCLAHFHSQDDLRKLMGDIGAPEAPPGKAGFFLGGNPGKAWFVIAPSTTYVVALRDDTVCAVFAQHADPDQVHADFSALVGTAPEPLVAVARDATGLGPGGADSRTMAYAWSRAGDKDELLFVLTTSSSSDATAQAMVSVSRTSRTAASANHASAEWLVDTQVLSCSPGTLSGSDTLVLRLGPGHGRELAIRRASDNTWYFLVLGNPPEDTPQLMSTEDFASASHVEIPPSFITRAWSADASPEPLLSRPGIYEAYVSDTLESEVGGHMCSFNVTGMNLGRSFVPAPWAQSG